MSNSKCQSSNQCQNLKSKTSQVYDLENRTAVFGENIINFVKKISHNTISKPLINQLIRSATSVGANYMEADGAKSKKDFRHKISLCKKEVKETKHWLRMLATALPEHKDRCKTLWKEAQELTLIFSSILKKSNSK